MARLSYTVDDLNKAIAYYKNYGGKFCIETDILTNTFADVPKSEKSKKAYKTVVSVASTDIRISSVYILNPAGEVCDCDAKIETLPTGMVVHVYSNYKFINGKIIVEYVRCTNI